MTKKILITAGGTGGHVFPALAVANQLRSQQYQVIWMGAIQGIENQIVPQAKIPLYRLNISGLRKKNLLTLVKFPIKLIIAFIQAMSILIKQRPDVIVGFGGYASFVMCMVGWLFRIPMIIHEQNAHPGLTNRILAKFAKPILVAFPKVLVSNKTLIVGNPVRAEIANIPSPNQRYDLTQTKLKVLVLGGSLGARTFNQIMPQVFAKVNNVAQIIHQVGRGDVGSVESAYNSYDLNAQVVNFIDDMAATYAQTDLIICRSGASTVSEIASCGIAAIFIPYPYAVDDHQKYNAQELVNANAAFMVIEKDLTIDKLADLINKLNISKCLEMANIAMQHSHLDTLTQICNIITQAIDKN